MIKVAKVTSFHSVDSTQLKPGDKYMLTPDASFTYIRTGEPLGNFGSGLCLADHRMSYLGQRVVFVEDARKKTKVRDLVTGDLFVYETRDQAEVYLMTEERSCGDRMVIALRNCRGDATYPDDDDEIVQVELV